jgi:hypothetical protein
MRAANLLARKAALWRTRILGGTLNQAQWGKQIKSVKLARSSVLI